MQNEQKQDSKELIKLLSWQQKILKQIITDNNLKNQK